MDKENDSETNEDDAEKYERCIIVLSPRASVSEEKFIETLTELTGVKIRQRTTKDFREEDIFPLLYNISKIRNRNNESDLDNGLEGKDEEKEEKEDNETTSEQEQKFEDKIIEDENTNISPLQTQEQLARPFSVRNLCQADADIEGLALMISGKGAISRVADSLLNSEQFLQEIFLHVVQDDEAEEEDNPEITEEEKKSQALGKVLIWAECEEEVNLLYEAFFAPPPLSDIDLTTPRKGYILPTKSNKVSLETLKEYLFPPMQQHSSSTGRLFVFGSYGPLDENSELRSGIRGQHVINKHEISAMVEQIDKNDLLYIYIGDQILSPEEQHEVIRQADPQLRRYKQITKEEVDELFAHLERDENGYLSFHDMQRVIFEQRKARIKNWKKLSASGADGKEYDQKKRKKGEKIPWNETCAIAGTGRGTYVKAFSKS